MAWELRGGRRYYYSSTRRSGRSIKAYVGHGAAGALAAALVAEGIRRRADRALALVAERARLASPERALAALDRACRLAIEAELAAAGYHNYDYRWRRRHVPAGDRGLAQAGGRG